MIYLQRRIIWRVLLVQFVHQEYVTEIINVDVQLATSSMISQPAVKVSVWLIVRPLFGFELSKTLGSHGAISGLLYAHVVWAVCSTADR